MKKIISSTNSQIKSLILEGYSCFDKNDIVKSLSNFKEAHKIATSIKDIELVSVCISWMALLGYLIEPGRYFKALSLLNDAKYLANSVNSLQANVVNMYVQAYIEMSENAQSDAIIILERALIQKNDDEYLRFRILYLLGDLYCEVNRMEDAYNIYNQALLVLDDLQIEDISSDVNLKIEKLKKLQQKKNEKSFELLNDKGEKSSKDPLVALLRVGRTIAVETNIDNLLKIIAEEIKLALNADRCTVFLLDKERNELWSKVALGMQSQEIRFSSKLGLAGHVAATGETINIKEAYSDSRFNKEIDQQTGYRTKTILCMPILNINHEIVGVFQVLNKFEGVFSESDEDLLIAIGSSAGIALENARLFADQQKMLEEQKELFSSFIDTLAASIDARDKITSGHSIRVTLYATLIAQQLNLNDKEVEIIRNSAVLHDIGKIGIKDSVLQKEGKLTDDEYAHIKEHVHITHDILNNIFLSRDFSQVVEIASSHHEKYDGSGYFKHLKGEEIPLGGRILAVSDVFDAITSRRHYRDKMQIEQAIGILIKDSTKHFDSYVVDAFLDITLDKIANVFLAQDKLQLKEGHQKILSKYKVMGLYSILTQKEPENRSPEEKTLIEIFDLYYSRKLPPDHQ